MLDTLGTHQSMMQSHPGAQVTFAGNAGERLTGALMKFNQKIVTVVTDNGQRATLEYLSATAVATQGRCQGQGHRH